MRGQGRRLTAVAVVALLAGAAWLGLAGPAPGSTRAEATLSVVPGLEAVTYGQTAAYVSTIVNTGTTTLNNVRFRMPIPKTLVDGQPQPATFQSATCTGTVNATDFTCTVAATVPPGQSASVTIAWKTPGAGSSADCPGAGPCLTASGLWFMNQPRTFPVGPVSTELLSQTDESKAATYALTACTDPSTPTLQTNQALASDNPLSTSICAPNLPASQPGLVNAIEERDRVPSDSGVTQVSDICIPAPGSPCDTAPFVFSTPATFTFRILNASLPPGTTITKVFHNGVLVSTRPRDDPHVEMIKVQPFRGLTTVVVESTTNGIWDFG
jgi:uncharacterized repeat protein (TIGR01451 family)